MLPLVNASLQEHVLARHRKLCVLCSWKNKQHFFGVNRRRAWLLVWTTIASKCPLRFSSWLPPKCYAEDYNTVLSNVNYFKSQSTKHQQTFPWSLIPDLCGLFYFTIFLSVFVSSFTSCISVCFYPSISPSAALRPSVSLCPFPSMHLQNASLACQAFTVNYLHLPNS